jgi:hypothetical protein
MTDQSPNKLRERVVRAAEAALKESKEVSPLEVLQHIHGL